jgi:hypothetical protein
VEEGAGCATAGTLTPGTPTPAQEAEIASASCAAADTRAPSVRDEERKQLKELGKKFTWASTVTDEERKWQQKEFKRKRLIRIRKADAAAGPEPLTPWWEEWEAEAHGDLEARCAESPEMLAAELMKSMSSKVMRGRDFEKLPVLLAFPKQPPFCSVHGQVVSESAPKDCKGCMEYLKAMTIWVEGRALAMAHATSARWDPAVEPTEE